MNESSSWYLLKAALQVECVKRMHPIHMVRVENLVSKGLFDTNVCYQGREFWLEGKFLQKFPLRKRTFVKAGLSDAQELFATRRLYSGGLMFLWLHVGYNTLAGTHASTVAGYERNVKDIQIERVRESIGRGWYLFKVDSITVIRELRYGLKQDVLLGMRRDRPQEIAVDLLDWCTKS